MRATINDSETLAVRRHLVRMRFTWAFFLATIPVAALACTNLPRLDPAAATPTAVTLVGLGASMWISFTAERDSRVRLDRGKRAFAVDGDLDRLLRNHWLVFMTVLFRLEILVVMGIVTAVWGLGPRVAVWFVLLAGLMMLLTWPSEHKTRLLIFRAKESD
jgi:hypothetical protein